MSGVNFWPGSPMQYASWLLSIFLHVAVAVLLIQTVHLAPRDLQDLLEVELIDVEQPEEIIQPVPLPASLPKPEPIIPEPEPIASEPPPAKSLPMDKTIVLDSQPPAPPLEPVPPAEPKVAAAPESNIVEISPVKVPVIKPEIKPEAMKAEPVQEEVRNKIILRKDDIIAHRGHEARFGRSMMADYYSYSSSEFSGQFKVRDGRIVSIIDARNTEYGRFLLYDSKHKTLRRLKESGKYIYTIGPSLEEDEPVMGIVIFLAKNDRIERFILVSKDDRLAHYPSKVHVREEEVTIPTNSGFLKAYTSLPPEGKNHRGVVFVHGDQCVSRGLILGFTRALSAQGLASLSVMPKWCGEDEPPRDSVNQLVSNTRAALSHFGNVAQVNFRHVGLWGNGPGIPIAVRAAKGGALSPAYMVCMVTDTTSPADMPDRIALARLEMPVLWLITGKDLARWESFRTMLEELRDKNHKRFTIVLAPTKEDAGMAGDLVQSTGWVESVTEDHARLATSWIQQIDD